MPGLPVWVKYLEGLDLAVPHWLFEYGNMYTWLQRWKLYRAAVLRARRDEIRERERKARKPRR
jgi:hypothetical protein